MPRSPHSTGTDYLLLGGWAMSLHGIERGTMDVDITIAMNPENRAALIGAAQKLSLTPEQKLK